MIFYSLPETLLLIAAAIVIDWTVGDPRRIPHPVIMIGKLIAYLERKLRRQEAGYTNNGLLYRGGILAVAVLTVSFAVMLGMTVLADAIHPWLGYAVTAWFISTTIAVKGLKDAAMLVFRPLMSGDMDEARKYTGYIVSRDTRSLDERGAARAAVETVAENIVDAFLSPLLFAMLGGAPLAMLYRAANTLDSMVGYRSDRYLYFGRVSARIDDALNYIPARLSALLLALSALLLPGMNPWRSLKSAAVFARRHPSPNSGFPEAAAAGAIGIELGGTNVYFGHTSERARMGWPLRPLEALDIVRTVRLLYAVSILVWIGVIGWWLYLLLKG
ncbi:adenosylcobinamide-phosphate synthase CbiB [Paenibacillus beijingensis]|uniref:Cobalamin biosynthesis protein CobD n=1 Tax=Paenibacillus beijingensis TaxID=1126833 RepID=A0A0D5NP39_9BACL|nr:adenosylcobinamide-phosphate synthase CbiB [Paenibacillus beijingensis]AJY76658.1 cobalamin biosynthesis protein [Paenibacillus beijingensis]